MEKIDERLHARLDEFLRAQAGEDVVGDPGAFVLDVRIRYEGDPAAILAAGVMRASVYPQTVYGEIRVSDLPAIVEIPNVIRVTRPLEMRDFLDESVPDAKVPAVWTGSPGFTGAGVVVGIIDSGIDITHNCFRRPNDGATRIEAIWDQTVNVGPNPSGFSYGTEYTESDINDALNADDDLPSNTFKHIDSSGHGTHVAGIAAGDGSQSGNCHLEDHYRGVAFDADIIVVKRGSQSSAIPDAVQYVFDLAGSRPAVVNMSFGGQGSGHDGTDDDEIAIDALLNPNTGIPQGRVAVASAGNEADDGQHAHKTLAAQGTEEMRFTILPGDRFTFDGFVWYGTSQPPGQSNPGDGSQADISLTLHAPDGSTASVTSTGTETTTLSGMRVRLAGRRNDGRPDRHRIRVFIEPAIGSTLMAGEWRVELEETGNGTAGGEATEVDFWIDPWHQWRGRDTISASGSRTLSFKVGENVTGTGNCRISYTGSGRLSVSLTTPDPDSTPTVTANAGAVTHDAGDDHKVEFNCQTNAPSNGNHRIEFSIAAKGAGKTVDKGDWTVTLTETAGHSVDFTAVFPEDRPYTTVEDDDGNSETVENTPRFIEADRDPGRTVGSPGTGNSVITVGAYETGTDNLADFSSRGPTIDGRQKPELSAPGVAITAPKTRVKDACCVSDCCETFYTNKQGTSMSAPHVAGVVALMLERNGALTFEQARTALMDTADAVAGANSDHWGNGKLNAENAVGHVLVSAGGGGGGGGGSIALSDENDPVFLPGRATWPLQVPTIERIDALTRILASSTSGSAVAMLVSTHFDEVKAIIDNSKRAAVAWHRMHGPELMRIALSWQGNRRPIIPEAINGNPVRNGIERLLSAVQPGATPELRAAMVRYAPVLLALPGATQSEIEALLGVTDGR
ncbi:MAG: S8 family serine peptidase [Ruegeria sp.]